MKTLPPELAAGALAGAAGLLVFLVIHHFWIQPIWFILPPGLVIAGLGGLAVGWMYAELLPHLPPRPWTALAVIALIGMILAPSIVLAELRESIFDISVPGGRLKMGVGQAALVFALELLVTALIAGGAAGWLIGHTPRAALATALAGLVFALGPGHNIPFLGSTPGAGKGIALLTAIVVVSAVTLVEAHSYLLQRGPLP